MDLSRFKAMTFDVVGTLIDFEGGMITYLRTLPGAASLADDRILDSYRRHRGDHPTKWFPDDLVRVYGRIAPELGLPATNEAAEGFRQSIRDWPAFPDSVEALQRLRARYKLVAMTNAQRWALDYMERTLGSPFHDSLSVDDARCEKPDPVYFGFVRGRLSRDGILLEEILHVAQSQYHDIGVAKRLGYSTCWIERRKGLKGSGGTLYAGRTEPDLHFATLEELADAVDATCAQAHLTRGALP
jgi:putative hydrolase of the HAD superfamily